MIARTLLVLTLSLSLAGVAHAEPVAHALVMHVPPHTADAGADLDLEAQIDAPFAEVLSVRWRPLGADVAWREAAFERAFAGGWFATIPKASAPGVEYYIRGRDSAGAEVAHFASEASPHVVRVVPSLTDRLEELDRARLGDRRNEVSLDVLGHDFGNRYPVRDRYLRGELAYTRRLWREIHHVSFGFGAIQGETPDTSAPDGRELDKGVRYGFGEARFRAHESVFLDARLALAASHAGFTGGVRGQMIFGKPWRSSVFVGGEYLGDVGGSAWVRLQWDTAPPLLMAASVVRTDLPGAEIAAAGLYIAYDVSYRVASHVTMKAQLSYGARDGEAHFGGGLGSAVDF
ncbi:MAG: hypothetical protein KIT31_24075 [Deltaproteobacteria bacterium]|nr:hypothetical protein [Deltaproteobacteria bacterium]